MIKYTISHYKTQAQLLLTRLTHRASQRSSPKGFSRKNTVYNWTKWPWCLCTDLVEFNLELQGSMFTCKRFQVTSNPLQNDFPHCGFTPSAPGDTNWLVSTHMALIVLNLYSWETVSCQSKLGRVDRFKVLNQTISKSKWKFDHCLLSCQFASFLFYFTFEPNKSFIFLYCASYFISFADTSILAIFGKNKKTVSWFLNAFTWAIFLHSGFIS